MLILAFHGKLGHFPVSDNQREFWKGLRYMPAFMIAFTYSVKTMVSTYFELKHYFLG